VEKDAQPRRKKVVLLDLAFESAGSLARALRLDEAALKETAQRCDESYPYRCWQEPKRSGTGFRLIEDPEPELKSLLRRVNRLLQRLALPRSFHGSIAGTSILSNAYEHRRKSCFLTFDLANYYKTIRPSKVYEGLVALRAAPDVARLLTRLATIKGRVPQGAPTSPMVAAIAMLSMARRLERLAIQFRGVHTIYGDNVCVSGPRGLINQAVKMMAIVRSEGFKVRAGKTVTAAFGDDKPLPGLVIHDGKPTLYTKDVETLASIIDQCARLGADGLNSKVCKRFRAKLTGMVNHYCWIDRSCIERPVLQFESLRWPKEHSRRPCESPKCFCWPSWTVDALSAGRVTDGAIAEIDTRAATDYIADLCPFDDED
jgi:hypothetical protein